jgi:hypothetical protein
MPRKAPAEAFPPSAGGDSKRRKAKQTSFGCWFQRLAYAHRCKEKEQDMNNIAKIISIFGGAKGIYASVENPPYMRLVIEDTGQGPRGHQAISVAHYFEQNGDLCQDPEMTFELIPEGANVRYEPLSFQQALPPVYQEVFATGSENLRLKQQLTAFAETWDRNIGHQGFVSAAALQQAKPAGTQA